MQHVICMQNFNVVLAGTLIWADGSYVDVFARGPKTSINIDELNKMHAPKIQGVFFADKQTQDEPRPLGGGLVGRQDPYGHI